MSVSDRTGTTEKPKLLVLIGPTAVGKTRLSLDIAKAWNAEIISGDSIQVYRGMDIGTAKIKPEEHEGIPHHLIDICDPIHSFSAAEFQERCAALFQNLHLAVNCLLLSGIPGFMWNPSHTAMISLMLARMRIPRGAGKFCSYAWGASAAGETASVDPDSAERLHPNDQRRIIRALEIYHLTGNYLIRAARWTEKNIALRTLYHWPDYGPSPAVCTH